MPTYVIRGCTVWRGSTRREFGAEVATGESLETGCGANGAAMEEESQGYFIVSRLGEGEIYAASSRGETIAFERDTRRDGRNVTFILRQFPNRNCRRLVSSRGSNVPGETTFPAVESSLIGSSTSLRAITRASSRRLAAAGPLAAPARARPPGPLGTRCTFLRACVRSRSTVRW